MQAKVNSKGYNGMMSMGHHFSCASSLLSILSADVILVMSAFSVFVRDIIIKIKEKIFKNIQEYAYASN